MSSREHLEFLFEAVGDLLHMSGSGGASELWADKFDKRWESYRQRDNETAKHARYPGPDGSWPPLTIDWPTQIAELMAAATVPLAKEVRRLTKRVADLERAAGVLEEEEYNREMTRIEEYFPDDL